MQMQKPNLVFDFKFLSLLLA